MGNVVARKLVFRLGEVGFSLDLSFVVEICEQAVNLLDSSYADPDVGIVGALGFRNTRVPAIDPALDFDLAASGPLSDKTALILLGPEGNWALLVDRVEAINAVDMFKPLDLPLILRATTSKHYSRVELFQNEPLVCFEPDCFYPASRLVL